MTTKQEIIDFLNSPANQFMDFNVKHHLIQMLKDLKPKVKKLELANFVDFKSLTQDIETFKKHHEQTILGALEDE
jgi:hypothetical protein